MDGFFRMDYARMREWAERALGAARPLGDRPLTAAAVAVLAFGNAASGATEEAETHLVGGGCPRRGPGRRRSSRFASTPPPTSPARSSTSTATRTRRPTRNERCRSRAATGQSEFIPLPYSILGQVKLLRGQLAEAGELLDNAVESARLSGNVQALAGNLVNRSLTALAAGDLEMALATAEENVELTRGLDQSLVCAAGVALAAALLENGDPGARRRCPRSGPRAATTSG